MIASLLSCCLSRQGLELPEGTQSSQILLVAVYSGGLGVLHALVPWPVLGVLVFFHLSSNQSKAGGFSLVAPAPTVMLGLQSLLAVCNFPRCPGAQQPKLIDSVRAPVPNSKCNQ